MTDRPCTFHHQSESNFHAKEEIERRPVNGRSVGQQPMCARISTESWILLVLCTLDALSSAILFASGVAVEGNPLLRPFADAGVVPFLLAKGVSYVPAIVAAEWYAQRRPELIRRLLRLTIGAYAAAYVLAVGGQFWLG